MRPAAEIIPTISADGWELCVGCARREKKDSNEGAVSEQAEGLTQLQLRAAANGVADRKSRNLDDGKSNERNCSMDEVVIGDAVNRD